MIGTSQYRMELFRPPNKNHGYWERDPHNYTEPALKVIVTTYILGRSLASRAKESEKRIFGITYDLIDCTKPVAMYAYFGSCAGSEFLSNLTKGTTEDTEKRMWHLAPESEWSSSTYKLIKKFKSMLSEEYNVVISNDYCFDYFQQKDFKVKNFGIVKKIY